MAGDPTGELLENRRQRILDAVALKKPDRVPVVLCGDAWAARVLGVPLADFCTKPDIAYPTMVEAFARLGGVDGTQEASFNVHGLSMLWLSKLKVPGRDLPPDEMWQVQEEELMTVDDYDVIVERGYESWLEDYMARHLPQVAGCLRDWGHSLPAAFRAWEEQGIVVFSNEVATIPYEVFCGARSMREFILDLHRRPDRVQAAMDAAAPVLEAELRQMIRDYAPMAVWVGGWRSASEFLSPRLWERFVFPYFKRMVNAAIEEGAIPVLHFDADWTRDLARLKEFPKGKCVLSLDGKTDIFKAKEILGDHMCIMGDVPARMLSLGTRQEVREYSKRLISEIGPEGFILAQGCDIPPDAKFENVKAMVDAVLG